MIPAYPLQWPAGWPRAPQRTKAAFNKTVRVLSAHDPNIEFDDKRGLSPSDGIDRVLYELNRLRVKPGDVVISTNLQLRRDGLPRDNQAEPYDPGAAVYWRTERGETKVMAIDRYTRVADNLAAIGATLEAMRAIARHGGALVMDRAFTGFDALPPPPDWRRILGVPNCQSIDIAETAYRALARQHHPDMGGSPVRMAELNQARDAARRELTK